MSAGDKDRSGFHRVGGSLTQNRSRDPTQEHEHCMPNMLAHLAGSSANPPTASPSAADLDHGRSGFCSSARRSQLLSLRAQRRNLGGWTASNIPMITQ